jgi:threonine dehydrogenase-like Zn-dependent dehydrogenase
MVGCCVAGVLARLPGASVQLVDINPERASAALALGVQFATPEQADRGRDRVIHASATAAGLQLSLELLAREGTVTELSWYGDREVHLRLGGSFHSGRLSIRSSQVGMVAPARRANRSYADRLALALDLLADPAFDALLTGESTFGQLPEVLAAFAAGTSSPLAHLITYRGE